jgi:hypothetical protein
MTESPASTSANQASRFDQAASRDIGSSLIGRRNTCFKLAYAAYSAAWMFGSR